MTVFFDRNWPHYTWRANKTFKWYGTDDPDRYKTGPHQLYGEDDIDYIYNSLGFRCDPLIPLTDDSPTVLFTGCSFTEGIGLPLEHAWPWILHQMICEAIGRRIPYWNIAICNTGMDTMARTLRLIGMDLRPSVVIALFPPYRREWYIDHQWTVSMANGPNSQILVDNPILLEPGVIHYEMERNMAMIDLTVRSLDALLIWDAWRPEIESCYQAAKDQLPAFSEHSAIWASCGFTRIDPTGYGHARDGLHHGYSDNKTFAVNLWQRYGDAIVSRLA